jgi:hypothetical protein
MSALPPKADMAQRDRDVQKETHGLQQTLVGEGKKITLVARRDIFNGIHVSR